MQSHHSFTLLGLTITVRLRAEESGGVQSIIEEQLPPGKRSPPHAIRQDATLYLLEGAITLTRNGVSVPMQVGDAQFIAQGVTRNIMNTGTADARLLVIVTPGGYERFLEDLSAAGSRLTEEPRLAAEIATRHGIELRA